MCQLFARIQTEKRENQVLNLQKLAILIEHQSLDLALKSPIITLRMDCHIIMRLNLTLDLI